MNIFPRFLGRLYATHIELIPMGILSFFLSYKGEAPTADVISVSAIGTGDILMLDPSGDKSDGIRHDLLWPYLDLRCIVERSRV